MIDKDTIFNTITYNIFNNVTLIFEGTLFKIV